MFQYERIPIDSQGLLKQVLMNDINHHIANSAKSKRNIFSIQKKHLIRTNFLNFQKLTNIERPNCINMFMDESISKKHVSIESLQKTLKHYR